MTKKIERRFNREPFQVRTNADGTIGVRGYAAVYDYEAHGEVIRSSAFNRTLEQQDDVCLLLNHNADTVMARTRNGSLTLGSDDHGLWFDAPSLDPTDPDVQRMTVKMGNGLLDQCSFAGYFTDVRPIRGINEVYEVKQLQDVSVVTFPWYDATDASITGDRELDAAALILRSLTPEQRAEVLATLDPVEPAPDGRTEPEPEPDTRPTLTVEQARALFKPAA